MKREDAMSNFTMRNKQIISSLCFLSLSLYFSRFYIDIGFSLKPFMVVTGIIVLVFHRKISFGKLFGFEFLMIVFILFHSLTAFRLLYPESSIRFILLYLIIIIYYFSLRGLVNKISIKSLENIISKAGLVGVVSSLAYYLIGIFETNMNFHGNNIHYYGLMIDRSIPRLTGTASGDPNIFVFSVTLYFFYTITNLQDRRNKFGAIISAIVIFLTLSRAAYISIIIGLIVLFLLSRKKKGNIKTFVFIILITFMIYFVGLYFNIGFNNFLIERFSNLSIDGGSGRLNIWTHGFETFKNNPIWGIGINSTLEYGKINYGISHYMHNSFIEVLVETGLIGFAIYILFWMSIFFYLNKIRLINRNTTFLFVTFISMLIQMNSLSILYNEAFYYALIVLYRYNVENLNRKSAI